MWQWHWGESWVTWVVIGSLGLGLGLVLVGCWWWRHRDLRAGTAADGGPRDDPLGEQARCEKGRLTMSMPGIVLGAFQGRTLRFRGEENVLVVGSARSGKGIGVIIPTCLEMPGHLVVVDIRGETWEQTAGWRASGAGGSRVLRLQLTKPGSTRYNLLDTIRRGTPEEFRDAATLAEMAVDSGGNKVEERNHWEKTSKALLTCALLYEVHRSWRPTLRNIAHFWSRPDMPILQTLAHVVQTAPTPEVAELAQELLNKDAREGTGVVSSMMTQLFVFRDPVLAANTCTSDFSLDDFLRTTPAVDVSVSRHVAGGRGICATVPADVPADGLSALAGDGDGEAPYDVAAR